MPFNGVIPNSILVVDATIHHVQSVFELNKEIGYLVLFLTPYSPNLNPVEETLT